MLRAVQALQRSVLVALAPAPSCASSAHAASPPARQVPREHKDRLKPTLRPLGWKGFKMAGLTPNMTRRAQAAPTRPGHGHGHVRSPREAVRPKEICGPRPPQVSTWLLYYRKELRGVPLETLLRRKQERAAAEVAAPADATVSPATGTTRQSII